MRIAVLTDIHGNDTALRAVLDDIASSGEVDALWILGDLAAIGPAPIEVLEILSTLTNTRIVRGNTDRYLSSGDRPPPTKDNVIADLSLLDQLIEVEVDFAWTLGAVATAGWLDWITNLPLEFRETLPDGTRALCVHASPGMDGGSGIHRKMAPVEIEPLLAGCKEDLICVGHTHQPFSIQVKGKRIINPGSVSNHVGRDVRACYALITADTSGYQIEFKRVDYDRQAVFDLLAQRKHPAKDFIIEHLQGKRIADA